MRLLRGVTRQAPPARAAGAQRQRDRQRAQRDRPSGTQHEHLGQSARGGEGICLGAHPLPGGGVHSGKLLAGRAAAVPAVSLRSMRAVSMAWPAGPQHTLVSWVFCTRDAQASQQLYMSALTAMLHEMRAARPRGTPFGHTQPLQAQFRPGAKASKVRARVCAGALARLRALRIPGQPCIAAAHGTMLEPTSPVAQSARAPSTSPARQAQRLAMGRARAPLAAAPSVWARRQARPTSLGHAQWSGPAHAAAARRERAFWARAVLRPLTVQPGTGGGANKAAGGKAAGPALRPLTLPEAAGYVTALSAAPCGRFVAAGGARGGVGVWDLGHGAPSEPWLLVSSAPAAKRMLLGAAAAPAAAPSSSCH